MDELLKEPLGGLALVAYAKNVELILSVSPDVTARLHGDSIRFRQVLMNLIGNAVKFTEHGEIVIGVSLESKMADSVLIRFSVRDTRIGIAVSQQPYRFDPFFQADS